MQKTHNKLFCPKCCKTATFTPIDDGDGGKQSVQGVHKKCGFKRFLPTGIVAQLAALDIADQAKDHASDDDA